MSELKFFKEQPKSLPQKNELPLDIEKSNLEVQAGESTVWKASISAREQSELVALKQVNKVEFADMEEMKKNQEFYNFLKSFPDFAKFVPDTLYFKARIDEDHPAQAYRLQKFIAGKPLDQIKDDELYKNKNVVRQLSEFVTAISNILTLAEKEKKLRPDLLRTPAPADFKTTLGGLFANPRYSSNIIVSEKPDKEGRWVYFVDTAANADERSGNLHGIVQRRISTPLQKQALRRWQKKLNKIIADDIEIV